MKLLETQEEEEEEELEATWHLGRRGARKENNQEEEELEVTWNSRGGGGSGVRKEATWNSRGVEEQEEELLTLI